MLLLIFCSIFFSNLYVLRSNVVNAEHFDKPGNFTIKYGNTAEIHFQIKDSNTKAVQPQLEEIRGELANILDKLNRMTLDHSTIQYPRNCREATAASRRSGVYQIQVLHYSQHPWLVRCQENTQGGGWTVILNREDGSENFFRNWNDYKHGFGNVNGEFFIGLDKLHAMTKDLDQELLIEMENWSGVKKFVMYDQFAIDNEDKLYTLNSLGEFSGDGGDSLGRNLNMKFSARDRDNDIHEEANCALDYNGGWWYDKCHTCNLTGKYNETEYGKGINWGTFNGLDDSLKRVQMMIRIRK